MIKNVIYITKDTISINQVDTKHLEKSGVVEEFKADFKLLGQKLEQHKKLLKDVRILFSDNLAYVINVDESEIKFDVNEKLSILNKAQQVIPEQLEEETWGYKKVKKDKNSQYIIFAPVKEVYAQVKGIFDEAGINITAVEPVAIAKTRHENEVYGLALKELGQKQDMQDIVEVTSRRRLKLDRKLIVLIIILVLDAIVGYLAFTL